MAINSAVNIDINVDGTATVNQAANAYEDLGDAVAKTQLEAERLAQQFGINDKRTQEAIKVAGRYKQEMEQLDFAIEAAKGGTDQLFRASQGVVAGFEVAAGAAAIFGGESEELEAALLKVQGAMALSQGLKDFNEFLPAIKNVTKSVAGPLISAFKSFGTAAKAAIASTGIGLLVVAVGTLVAYWDDIKAAVSGVSEEQKKLLKDQEASVAASKQQLDNISAQENILKQQGYTEQEILNMKIAATKNTITELEAQIKQQKIVRDQQIETAKRNKEILSGILKFVEAPLYILLKGIDVALNAFGKESDLANQFADFGASLLFDPEEVEKEADAAIEAQEKELQTMKNNLAGYEMSITKIHDDQRKEREDKQKAADEKEDQRLKERLAKEKEIARQRELLDKDQFEQRRILAEREFNDMVEGLDKESQAYLDAQAIRNEKLNQIDKDQKQKELDDFNKSVEEQAALQEYLDQIDEENKQKEIEREQAVQDAKMQIFEESKKLTNAIIGMVGEQTKAGKALALAQIVADTAIGFVQGLDIAQKGAKGTGPAAPYTFPIFYLSQIGAVLNAAAQAKKVITSGSTSGASPRVSSRPGVPQMAAPRLGGVLNPDNEITQQRKVYVVESDITSTQAKVSNTQKVSLVE